MAVGWLDGPFGCLGELLTLFTLVCLLRIKQAFIMRNSPSPNHGNSDRQGKGRGEKAIERNTSRSNENGRTDQVKKSTADKLKKNLNR